MRFTVTAVEGCKHQDTWSADNGTGSCDAEWVQVAGGGWKISRDAILFTPAAAEAEAEEGGTTVVEMRVEAANAAMMAEFQPAAFESAVAALLEVLTVAAFAALNPMQRLIL